MLKSGAIATSMLVATLGCSLDTFGVSGESTEVSSGVDSTSSPETAGSTTAPTSSATTDATSTTASSTTLGASICGDMTVDPGETCDDGNKTPLDGCDNGCEETRAAAVYGGAGANFTCVRFFNESARARCWGYNRFAQLGYGIPSKSGGSQMGDSDFGLGDEPGEAIVDRSQVLPGIISGFAAGDNFNCAIVDSVEVGNVYCWGYAYRGLLGKGTGVFGADEYFVWNPFLPSQARVSLGLPAVSLGAGAVGACAVLTDDSLWCWGYNDKGQAGLGMVLPIGDDEAPGMVNLQAKASQVTGGLVHTCVLTKTGDVKCWGEGANGRLGYGNAEMLAAPPIAPVEIGTPVVEVAAGGSHTCALLLGGAIRCWGMNSSGQLGRGDFSDWGGTMSTIPNDASKDIWSGEENSFIQVKAGLLHTCALDGLGQVFCWGSNKYGQLGYERPGNINGDEPSISKDPVALERPAAMISVGREHSCALLDTGDLYCWGRSHVGQLGQGDMKSRTTPILIQYSD